MYRQSRSPRRGGSALSDGRANVERIVRVRGGHESVEEADQVIGGS